MLREGVRHPFCLCRCLVLPRDVHRLYEVLIRDGDAASGMQLSEGDESLRNAAVAIASSLDDASTVLGTAAPAVVAAVQAALPHGAPTPRLLALSKQVCAAGAVGCVRV